MLENELYVNNKKRKSFQWQVWTYCNNGCRFCFLGKENRKNIKERQLKSLNDLNDAIDNLNFNEYNNISLIGGEFFQGQLEDKEIRTLFFNTIKKIFQLYVDKKIGSIWITCTLTSTNQDDLYYLLDMADDMKVHPVEEYGASGLWLCTSWDTDGRFHTTEKKNNWEYHIKNIKAKYPWIKLNTTIILQDAFLDLYLNNEFKPKKFMKEFNTSVFYMQPCLEGITELMVENEEEEKTYTGDFSDYWLKLKQEFQKKYKFFPERNKFIRFLTKYYNEDRDTYDKLFNIKFRSDEIHININSEDHDRTIGRVKDGNGPEECFPPAMKCGHIYNYAPYINSNHCCICDRDAIKDL